jgi:hypothetical protein
MSLLSLSKHRGLLTVTCADDVVSASSICLSRKFDYFLLCYQRQNVPPLHKRALRYWFSREEKGRQGIGNNSRRVPSAHFALA